MSILGKITTGRRARAQKVVIYAPEGFGKSTLASKFPHPLFLDIEDSTSQIDVARLRREDLPNLKAFESALDEIAKSRPCKTLIVDTFDWLEQMALEDIVASAGNAKITGIEDFGYGKGYTILRERITIVLAKLDAIIGAGINVVLLAHAKVSKFEPPDGAGPYDRYELKLSKHVAPLIKEWADMLLFGNWRVQVREKDKNESGAQFKGVGGRERLLHCNRTAAWDAKNRHGLADIEPWGKDAEEAIKVVKKGFDAVGAPWGNLETRAVESVEETPLKGGESSEKVPVDQPSPTPEPPSEGASSPELSDLARICEPHAEAINAYLIAGKKIKAGETFLQMTPDLRKRVLGNPAGFLKVATAAKGGAK